MNRSAIAVFTAGLLALSLLMPLASTAAGGDKKVKEFITGIVAAYGGEKAVRDAKRVYATGRITAYMRGDTGTYTRWLDRDGRKLRVETRYTKSSETRMLSGKHGRRGMDGDVEDVTGFQYLAMVYQYKQQDLIYGLMTGRYKVRYDQPVTDGAMTVEAFNIEDAEGPPMSMYVDPKTMHILEIEGRFNVNGQSATLSAQFSDFRKVKGLLVPYRIKNFGTGGVEIGETNILKYEINGKMEPTLFKE